MRPRARPAPTRAAPAVGTGEEAVVDVAGVTLALPVAVGVLVTVTTGVVKVVQVDAVLEASVYDFTLVLLLVLTVVLDDFVAGVVELATVVG